MASWLLASKPICSADSGSARPPGLLGPLPWGRGASQAGAGRRAGDARSFSLRRKALLTDSTACWWESGSKVGDLLWARSAGRRGLQQNSWCFYSWMQAK